MKKFSKVKTFLLSVCAFACSLGFLLLSGTSSMLSANAASPAITLTKLVGDNQKTTPTLNSVAGGNNTLYLFPNNNEISSIKEVFAYYKKDKLDTNGSTANELIHNAEYKAFNNDVINDEDDGQFVSIINLSNNIILAMNKGYVSVSASANTKSTSSSSKSSADNPETITTALYVYDEESGLVEKADSAGQSTDYVEYVANLSSSSLSDKMLKKLALSFTTTFTKAYSKVFGKDFLSTTGKNYMAIQNPTLNFTTADVTAPEVNFDKTETVMKKGTRDIKLSASDDESGLFKVEVKENGNWVVIEDYAKDLVFKPETEVSYTVSQNGTYEFRVTDNIGNSTEISYNETNLDNTAPSVEVELAANYNHFDFSFNANLISDGMSEETYYYTYSFNGKTSENIELKRVNDFFCDESGEYTFTFYAYDKLNNIMQPITKTTTVIDSREVVTLTINDAEYNPNGFVPTYSASVASGFDVEFSYFSADGQTALTSIENVGSYLVKYKISNDLYVGKGEQIVNITKKNVEVYIDNTASYVYTGEILNLKYSLSEEIEREINFTQNGQDVSFLNAGTYNYSISTSNSNYNLVYESTVVVTPYELLIEVTQNSFEFDGTAKEINFIPEISGLSIVVTYILEGITVEAPTNANTYVAEFSLENTTNYSLNFESTLTITKKAVIVTANSVVATYGEKNIEFAASANGLVDGDEFVFNAYCDYQMKVGEYDIFVEQKENFENYSVTYVSGKLTIKAKQIIVSPDKLSKVYGDADPVLTYTVTGLENGDSLSGELSREEGNDIGYYLITLNTLSNSNYELTIVPTSFQITKRLAFVIVSNASKVYGEADPAFAINFAGSNILSSDEDEFLACLTRKAGENVGQYEISFNKAGIKNYTIFFEPAVLKITPKTITVTADSTSKTYGETDPALTYVVDGLASEDVFSGTLVRAAGENVGEYKITIGSLSNSNYFIEFVPANFVIEKRHITVSAVASSKVYGTKDIFEAPVIDGTDEILNIKLVRTAGENVGTYSINSYEFNNENYEVDFLPATFEITPAKLLVEVKNASKVYGEADPKFNYSISGLVGEDTASITLARTAGENVGDYVISVSEFVAPNYVIECTSGTLSIEKANLNYVLSDKSVIYDGSVFKIDEIETDFELVYTYTFAGTQVSDPVNAGEYRVQAKFAGNDNFNAWTSNTAKLTINKKFIPIILKESKFIYNGKEQNPIIETNLDIQISLNIMFENDVTPIEIGDYNFVVESNNSNYYADFEGVLSIVSEFYANTNSGNISVSTDNVSINDESLSVYENKTSPLMNLFNSFRDERRCVSVYNFNAGENYVKGEVFTVKIKANAGSDVQIYSVDKTGKRTLMSYAIEDGYYTIRLNDFTGNIVVTESVRAMYYAKIIMTIVVIVLAYAISKIVLKVYRNKFYSRNTCYHKFNSEELKKNAEIVVSKLNNDGMITSDEFLSIQKK